jgi:ketosteroid isomerase-like protein
VTIAALVLCGFAPDDLTATLHTRYDAMKAAMAAHDSSAVAAILAPDFTSVDASGRSENASQMVSEVSQLKPDPNKTSETTLEAVSRQGDTAIVQQRYDMRTTKTGADGAQHRIELVTLSADTWVKPQAVWLLQRTVTNELSYYLDGVMVAHKVRQ